MILCRDRSPRTPARRVVLAISLSILIHAIILWLRYLQFPQAKVQLPPLFARLTVMLKNPSKPIEQSPGEQIIENPHFVKPDPANPLTQLDKGADLRVTKAMAAMNRTEETAATRVFPKHLQLTFIIYQGTDGFRAGEIHHQLIQTSRGKFGKDGFQPDLFEEVKITTGDKQGVQATFDWVTQKLRYSHGHESALPADAQDVLSFMYQISQLPMRGNFFRSPSATGRSSSNIKSRSARRKISLQLWGNCARCICVKCMPREKPILKFGWGWNTACSRLNSVRLIAQVT